jgi:S-layer homology domain
MGQRRLPMPLRKMLIAGLALLLLPLLAGGLFGPHATAQAAVQAVNKADTTGHFADIPAGYPYGPAIDALLTSGVVSGYLEDGTLLFKPEDPVLRAQFAKMICGALDIPVIDIAVHRPRLQRPPRPLSERLCGLSRGPRHHYGDFAGRLLPVGPRYTGSARDHDRQGGEHSGPGRSDLPAFQFLRYLRRFRPRSRSFDARRGMERPPDSAGRLRPRMGSVGRRLPG